MKKMLILTCLISSIFILGCKRQEKDIVSKLKDNIESLEEYRMTGTLEIMNNEDIYKYEVDSAYKKDDLFRVSLRNTGNNHLQILLKNGDGVYVITPALNKSFKFQSDWPYNNSQIYLLQTILKDIQEDKNVAIEEKENGYIIKSKVNYSNNDKLVKQNVYIDKNYNIYKVDVLDNKDIVLMSIKINKIDKKPNLDKNYFELSNSTSVEVDEVLKTSTINNILYPMYIPSKTYLSSQDRISLDNGERVILTFDGDNPFMLIQETWSALDNNTVIPTYGEFDIVSDTIGVMKDNSISWSSNGIDYYVTSDSLSEKELLSVANSVTILPVGK